MEGYWKVYFETKHKNYDEFLKEISDNSEKAVWYFHPGGKKSADRPHIHGLLYNYNKTDDTLRKYIKKQFQLTKTSEFAISNSFSRGTKMTEMFYPKYITYMSKGQYDPVNVKGFERAETDRLKSEWKDHTTTANIIIEPREKIKKKLTYYQIARACQAEYMAIYQSVDFEILKMIAIVCRVLKENSILAHKLTVRNIIQDIQAELDFETFQAEVYKMV